MPKRNYLNIYTTLLHICSEDFYHLIIFFHYCLQGMENIQTISLHLSELKEIGFTTNVFVKMKKLRLLKIYNNDHEDHEDLMRKKYKVLLLKNFEFPHNLRYLHWDRCTLKSFPSKFYGEKLIEINLKSSNLKQLWKGNQV